MNFNSFLWMQLSPFRVALASALLLFSASNQAAAADCDGRPCVTIGTYNIKLLGNGGPANTAKEIDSLAERIDTDAEFDVLVLVEININSAEWNDQLMPALELRGFSVTGAGAFGGADVSRQQHVVLLHRKSKITVIADAEDLATETSYDDGSGCAYDSVRPVTTARYQAVGGRFDFRVYGVHLKSNRPVNGLDKCDDEIRAHQIGELAEAIGRYEKDEGEGDHIVTGDFNMPFASSEIAPLRSIGYRTQIDAPCSKSKIWNCSYVIRRYAGVIDHVAIDASTAEVVAGSGAVFRVDDIKNYIQTQSDHVPVLARFFADLPDDD